MNLAAAAAYQALAGHQPYPNTAAAFHDRAESALRAAGWQTRREVRVDGHQGRGGRSGFLDLVATHPQAGTVAIELDRLSPRRKSLHKLAAYRGANRLVVLRCRRTPSVENGIVIAGLEVRP